MKSKSGSVLFSVALACACLTDLFLRSYSAAVFILAFVTAFCVFRLPRLKMKISRLVWTFLFTANFIILYLTFSRIYLLNVLFLSFLIWHAVTPCLRKYHALLPLSVLAAFVSAYAAAFSPVPIVLFPVVYYPVYLAGISAVRKGIPVPERKLLFGLLNLMLLAALAAGAFFVKGGRGMAGKLLFLSVYRDGTVNPVFYPFAALFLIWFSCAFIVWGYTAAPEKKRTTSTTDFSALHGMLRRFLPFACVLFVSMFVFEFSSRLSVADTLKSLGRPNILFNFLILCGGYLCLLSLVGRGISNLVVAALTVFIAVANSIKFFYFDEPFYPWDLYLIKNLVSISKEYLNIPIVILFITILACAVVFMVRRREQIAHRLTPHGKLILLPFAALIIIVNILVLRTPALFSQVGLVESWYIGKGEIRHNGVLAQNFFYQKNLRRYLNPEPENYSEASMRDIEKRYSASQKKAPTTRPDIVVIMSETCWDITRLDGISFSDDILKNVHARQMGFLVPPVIGGGTANTEFEVLTGMSLFFMSPGIIPYNTYLRRATPSVASVLKDSGYSTVAIHPNIGTFYNRDKVYRYFGFDRFYDDSSFDKTRQCKGPNIADDALICRIYDILEESDDPAFVFAVSMQNHDPYENKYTGFDIDAHSDRLSDRQNAVIRSFTQGLYDADRSFGKLIAALEKRKKPVIVYFFGDHAPRLGSLEDYYAVYDLLGMRERNPEAAMGNLKYYMTPYAAWSNCRTMRSFPEPVSPAQLSWQILHDANVPYPSYFDILHALEKRYPVMHPVRSDLVDENDQAVRDYRMVQYDLLFGKQYLNNGGKR